MLEADLPKKLNKDLILSAVFELRFSPKIPPEAVYGMVYQVVACKYPRLRSIRLPITQLPEVVRNSDPNLVFQPYNILEIDTRGIGIGPKVINFSVKKPYIGWEQWSSFINNFVMEFTRLGILGNIERTGLRFVNFTEQNLCEIANMSVQIGNSQLSCQPMTLRAEIQEDNFVKIVQLVNNAVIDIEPFKQSKTFLTGSVIDIEVIRTSFIT
jgi:uncharacterized protein (TIGR04255 family)